MTNAVHVENLSKSFVVGKRLLGPPKGLVKALHLLDLDVIRGETLGIVGESGCGKSTLARMLVGLLQPTTGLIEISGEPLQSADPRLFGRKIQYVFQDPVSSLNPRKTIRQIMEAPLIHLHGLGRDERARRISEIFEMVSLREEFLDRYPHEFSGGQAQRIGIARALAADAEVLVLDEPVSALDVSVQAQVLNLLTDLKSQLSLTYLFISHDLAVVEAVSDRIAVLYFGSIVEIGAAEKVFSNPRHPYTKLLADSAPVVGRPLAAPETAETELPDPLDPPTGCAFRARCRHATAECAPSSPSLEGPANHQAACFHPVS
ncbi:oligopeptide/dipeptide ABC transporter ATP-binding protein [uncultured Roseibium sp.]|uniref:ABC transporter ATP-binding protein n=1 Tax=uncultured Roseibium sp. TaxID=1936171 RepID=UPI002596DB97|nr:oligopeptide/dipeptide ABC transporter ATP-binding protein [uncultured Roseibium sp.]